MPSTTNSHTARAARVAGVVLSVLLLVPAWAWTWPQAEETPRYHVRGFGVMDFPVSEPTLLGMPGVQEELKLTEAQKKEHAAIVERRFEALQQLRRDLNLNDRARFRAARDAAFAETERAVRENLTGEQRQRLDQIRLQLMGPLAFARARPGRETAVEANLGTPLAERLKLAEDQVRQIQAIIAEGVPQIDEAASFPLKLDTTNGPPSADAVRALIESPEFTAAKQKAAQAGREARAAIIRRIEEVLTENQRTSYHKLLGAPFDLSRLAGESEDSPDSDRRFVSRLFGIGGGGGGQRADPSFDTKVARPAYADSGRRPRVLFDEAHKNFHTATSRYKPFAELITSDGYQVIPNRKKLTRAVLDRAEILVIANAQPDGGEGGTNESGSPFSGAESDAVRDWVQDGGWLLLITDHAPFGPAAARLAQRFGVEVSKGGATSDDANSENGSTWLVFSRQNHLLGDHPITRGRDQSERVNRVQTFTGTSLKGPEGSVVLYKLADTAVDHSFDQGKPVSAAGRCQGLALSFGRGRVVVLGEAGELSAQVVGADEKFGMNVPGIDNRQMALNVMHWLSGLLEPREKALKKAG